MQMVIVLPSDEDLQPYGGAQLALFREVCGIPLLVRVMATAVRAGVHSALVIHRSPLPPEMERTLCTHPALSGLRDLQFREMPHFLPASATHWRAVAAFLEDEFFWLPWNWVSNKHSLAALKHAEARPASWSSPARLTRAAVLFSEAALPSSPAPEGVKVTGELSTRSAEGWLVAHSGKPLDGMYSTFNRRLCRPAVRALSNTFISPNLVTLAGLLAAIASAYCYAQGTYLAYVAGALLFFISGLADEADGMLARVRFADSAFGTWFEGAVDNVTYLLLFAGITLGLYKERGPQELLIGEVLLVGCVLASGLVSWQRKRSTHADRPAEYLGNLYQLMDRDRGNWISRIARQINVFVKKAAVIHYVLIFTVLGLLPLLLRMAALAANVTWILTLYFSYRFFRRPSLVTGIAQFTAVPRR